MKTNFKTLIICLVMLPTAALGQNIGDYEENLTQLHICNVLTLEARDTGYGYDVDVENCKAARERVIASAGNQFSADDVKTVRMMGVLKGAQILDDIQASDEFDMSAEIKRCRKLCELANSIMDEYGTIPHQRD